jgi:hypothetical protein
MFQYYVYVYVYMYVCMYVYVCAVLGFELRVSCLLGTLPLEPQCQPKVTHIFMSDIFNKMCVNFLKVHLLFIYVKLSGGSILSLIWTLLSMFQLPNELFPPTFLNIVV